MIKPKVRARPSRVATAFDRAVGRIARRATSAAGQ